MSEPNQDNVRTISGNIGTASGIDRDALLELADEMDRHADMAAGHVAYAARFDFAGWARRIREALGAGR